jgi:DNA (cytosine-5)-methyltransferase 1
MECAWQSEINEFASSILAHHWPGIPNHGDITKIKAGDLEEVGLIHASYPCQPFSLAGKRSGEADPRHLWPHVWRICRALRPRWITLENVLGHLTLGFDRVLGDLAQGGYLAAWDHLTAAQFGAPHLRRRLFIVARDASDTAGLGSQVRQADSEADRAQDGDREPRKLGTDRAGGDASDSSSARLEERGGMREADELAASERGGLDASDSSDNGREGCEEPHEHGSRKPGDDVVRRCGPYIGESGGIQWQGPAGYWAETESPVLSVAHGITHDMAGSRRECLTAIGNAVVPQIAEWIGRRIMRVENEQ